MQAFVSEFGFVLSCFNLKKLKNPGLYPDVLSRFAAEF